MLKSTSDTELPAPEPPETCGTTVHGNLVGSTFNPSSDDVTFTVVDCATVEVAVGVDTD